MPTTIPFNETTYVTATASSIPYYIDVAWGAGGASAAGGTYTVSGPGVSYTKTVGAGHSDTGSASIYMYPTLTGTWTVSPTSDGVQSVTATANTPPPTYPPSWTDNTLGSFQVGTAYSDGVTASNMSYSGAYSLSSGSLPIGTSLDSSTGAVTGTPTTVGVCSFTISATNSYGSISQSFTTTVAAAPSYPPIWTDQSLSGFVIGSSYSDGVAASNMSYSGSYSVSSGTLPTGISLTTSTGAITGTPTVAGPYSFVLTATNTYDSINASFSGIVMGGVLVYDGTSWVKKTVKVYSGSAWVSKPVKIYNGSSWTVAS